MANKKSKNIKIALQNSAFSLFSLLFRMVGSSLILIIIARLPGISIAEFGQLTYAMTISALAILISQFGLNSLLIRDIAADPSRLPVYARSAFTLRLVFSIVGFALLLLYLHVITISDQGRLVCIIIAIAFYLDSFSIDMQALYQSKEKMHFELFSIVTGNGIVVVLMVCAYFWNANIINIAMIYLVTRSITLVINYFICGHYVIWLYPISIKGSWKKLIWAAAPFALSAVITTGITQIDTILLRELWHDAERAVGLYQAAIRLFFVPLLLPQIVLKVFLPQFSRMHGLAGGGLIRDLKRVNHVLLTIGLLLGLVTVFRGNDLVALFYGKKLAAAGPVLQVLGITIMMRFGAAYNLYFTIRNMVWFRVWTGLFGLITVIILNCLFIPKYGIMGGAYASVLSHIIYWIPWLVSIYKHERTILLGWRWLPGIIAATILVVVLYFTAALPIVYMLPIYSLSVVFLTFMTMPAKERSLFISMNSFKGD